jgi:hypothetical protein
LKHIRENTVSGSTRRFLEKYANKVEREKRALAARKICKFQLISRAMPRLDSSNPDLLEEGGAM